jgi:hypothetical protein
MPYCASAQAAVRPVMPPPTMTMGWWLVSPLAISAGSRKAYSGSW